MKIKKLTDSGMFINLSSNYDSELKRKKYYCMYAVIFCVMSLVIFSQFLLYGKSFVWADDGWTQHYKALVYYAQWMRGIVYNFIESHEIVIPTYSFSMGYGSDIFTSLHYYVIGDPLNLLAILVPTDYIVYLYCFLILLRYFLSGVAFSEYCFYVRNKREWAVLLAAFVYVFSGYALVAGVRHPYFINPMIYFPLILLGVEKILNKEKPKLFIIMVAVSAISNFYFFYMIVLLVILYVGYRLFQIYWKNSLKMALKTLVSIGIYAVVGVMISAVIFVPVVYLFLGDARSDNGYVYDLLYPISYYERILASYITFSCPGYWNYLGYSVIALIALFLLLSHTGHRGLKIIFTVLTLFLLFPTIGSVFNGFNYVSNRWIWGYSLLLSYIVLCEWENIINLKKENCGRLLFLVAIYFVACILLKNANSSRFLFSMVILAFVIVVCVILPVETKTQRLVKEGAVFALSVVSICVIALLGYSVDYGNYVSEFKDIESVNDDLKYTEASAIKATKDQSSFYRYSGSGIVCNSSLYSGLSNTQYYWSLSNGNVTEMFKELWVPEILISSYRGLDDRTILNTLAGVKYYVTNKDGQQYKPYGFEKKKIKKKESTENYVVYENQYALPLGYTYSNYMLAQHCDNLNAIDKQELMLQTVILDDETTNEYAKGDPEYTSQSVKYDVVCNDEFVSLQDGSFIVTSENASVTLNFEGLEDAETYLSIEGLTFEGCSEWELYNSDEMRTYLSQSALDQFDELSLIELYQLKKNDKYWISPTDLSIGIQAVNDEDETVKKTLPYYAPSYQWYSNRHDFLVNLCYDENKKTSITIVFPSIGVYSFENIDVLCQPMDQYASHVSELGEDVLENIDLHEKFASATNTVSGTISLEQPKILCLAIPYSRGWTAYVDGEKQELKKANIMYMALELEAGNHDIQLVYKTPFLKEGFVITCLGLICFLGILIAHRGKTNNSEK